MARIRAEFSFLWRRWFTVGWVAWNSLLTTLIICNPRMDASSLMWIAIVLTVSNMFAALYYMAGASAVDIGKIVQGLAELRPGRHHRDDDEDEPPTLADDGKPI